MIIFPAIDLYDGKAVRLYQGDYREMTVYSEHPEEVLVDFLLKGAMHVHLVDLEGAKTGTTPNLTTVMALREAADLFAFTKDPPEDVFLEIGGGIRSMETAEKYLSVGMDRVILGTAAVTDPGFLKEAVAEFGEKIAVGADLRDGYVSLRGWTENSGLDAFSFFERMVNEGVRTVICTDVSKDGAMQGTNRELYRELSSRFPVDIVASGGVSSIQDVAALTEMGLYGAIIGKAYYTGAIDLREAVLTAMGGSEGGKEE